MIRKLKKDDLLNFQDYCVNFGQSLFSDCSFKNLKKIFDFLIKNNSFCIVDDENSQFRGILFLEKIENDYYVKSLYKNPKILDRLLMFLMWNINKDLIFKLNDYKSVSIIKKYFFKFKEKIDNDYVYIRKYLSRR